MNITIYNTVIFIINGNRYNEVPISILFQMYLIIRYRIMLCTMDYGRE